MRNLESIAEDKGLQLIDKRQISSAGYSQSNGKPIVSKNINEYIFKK
ncbi:hypothetical protein [Gilliamella intestini]|nr:hypothetical protein [Gilliamella intestini]